MSKIIHFSSVYEERCVEQRIDTVKKELKKERISKKKLQELQEELYHLSLVITEGLKTAASLTQTTMNDFLSQQAELGTLIYNCQNLFIDKKVDKLTQHAQKIAQASLDPYNNVSIKIGKLQKSLLSLTHQEALSLENRQMINLAKKYLHDAEARCFHETVMKDTKTIRLDFKKANAHQDLIDPYDLSLSLYEIAGELYHHRVGEALFMFSCLSFHVQEEIRTMMTQNGISFEILKSLENLQEWKIHLYGTLQTLIGYSNQALYGFCDTPSMQEIDSLFKDLDAILKEENSANF